MNGEWIAAAALPAAVVLVVALAPLARAPAVDTLQGRVTFGSAEIDGARMDRTALDAGLLTSQEQTPLSGRVEIRADEVTVNWSRIDEKGVADPQDRDRTLVAASQDYRQGQETYADANVTVEFSNDEGDLLFLPRPDAKIRVDGSRVAVAATDGEEWWSGRYSNRTEGDNLRLVQRVEVPSGSPVYRTTGPSDWRLRGDLLITVWGYNVTLREDRRDENVTYRSGVWYSNETADTARDEHRQFLRLRLSNATVSVDHDAGRGQWTADEAKVHSSSGIELRDASGRLRSGTARFQLDRTDTTVKGDLDLFVSSAGERRRLASRLQGDDTWIDLEPSGSIATGASGGSAPLAREIIPPIATLIAVTGAIVVLQRRGPLRPIEWIRSSLAGSSADPRTRSATVSDSSRDQADPVLGFVGRHPGATARDLADASDMHYKTARYHLESAVGEGDIERKRVGNSVRYFSAGRFSEAAKAMAGALADPTKSEIVESLDDDDAPSVSAIADAVGVSVSTASKHLKTLRRHGLVVRGRDGRRVRYRLSDAGRDAYLALS